MSTLFILILLAGAAIAALYLLVTALIVVRILVMSGILIAATIAFAFLNGPAVRWADFGGLILPLGLVLFIMWSTRRPRQPNSIHPSNDQSQASRPLRQTSR